jgi:hypothetical protein
MTFGSRNRFKISHSPWTNVCNNQSRASNRLQKNYFGTQELRWFERLEQVQFVRFISFIWLASFNQTTRQTK